MILTFVYLIVVASTFTYGHVLNSTITSATSRYLIGHSVVIINDKDGIFVDALPNVPKLIVDKETFVSETTFGSLYRYETYNDYIIADASEECELEILLNASKNYSLHNANSRFVVIVNDERCLRRNFELLGTNFLYNVIVIQLKPELLIYSFSNKNDCDRFSYTEISYKYIPMLMKEYFRNCNVSVLWSPTELYVHDPYNAKYPGVFIELINTIAERDDLNLIYVKANEEVWLEFKESGSYYNVWDNFNEGINEIYCTAINLKYDLRDLFDTSVPIHEDKFIWLIPLEENMFDWRSMFLVLSPCQWIYMILLFIFMGLSMRLLAHQEQFFKNISNCYLYVFATFLSVSYVKNIYSNKVRLLIISYVIPMFIFCTYFQGRLYATLTTPMTKLDYSSVEDFLVSDLPIITEENFAVTLLLEDPYYYTALFRFILSRDSMQEMYEIAKENNYIAVVNEGVLVTNPHDIHKFNAIDFQKFQNIIVFKKDFYLTNRLNMQISRLKESGIVNKWFDDIKWDFYIENDNNRIDDIINTNFEQLKLNHMICAFITLSIGYGLSLIIFLIEYIRK